VNLAVLAAEQHSLGKSAGATPMSRTDQAGLHTEASGSEGTLLIVARMTVREIQVLGCKVNLQLLTCIPELRERGEQLRRPTSTLGRRELMKGLQ